MIWKQSPSFPDYSVSDTGLIMRRKTRRVLQPIWDRCNQRLIVKITKDGTKYQNVTVAILILEAFVPRPYPYARCLFKDGNPYHLFLENLEWLDARNRPKILADPAVTRRKCSKAAKWGMKAGKTGSRKQQARNFAHASDPTYEEPVYE